MPDEQPGVNVSVIQPEAPESSENGEDETEEIQTTADAILEDTKWLKERIETLTQGLARLSELSTKGENQAALTEVKAEINQEIASLRIELQNLKTQLQVSPSSPTSTLAPDLEAELPVETLSPDVEVDRVAAGVSPQSVPRKRRRI